ncbi:MAG: radical SAM protein [Cyanobacteria bacterium QS_4_48_99]|nr:MAG: radical SAM protein [Cyanobacteria bacterium QS_4_48_99]PSO90524.1 MAG: radical SAM protein [Cyanobacteria bacterium QS_9_48_30]
MSEITEPTANLVEVFSAIQGEGLNVGTRQIFIRFAKCDLRCHFCDSDHTWELANTCRMEVTPGARDFESHSNPVALSTLLQSVERQNLAGLHESVSITGGEPLLHARFLKAFLPQLRESTHLPIYLETGGHRPQQLSMVLPYLDWVGMDMKLPSVSGEQRWTAHAEFLRRCCDASVGVFVKLIVSSHTEPAELEHSARLVAAVNPEIPVFLQPVTPLEEPLAAGMVSPPSAEQVLTWQTLMKRTTYLNGDSAERRMLKQVRVVPQTHKMIGQL